MNTKTVVFSGIPLRAFINILCGYDDKIVGFLLGIWNGYTVHYSWTEDRTFSSFSISQLIIVFCFDLTYRRSLLRCISLISGFLLGILMADVLPMLIQTLEVGIISNLTDPDHFSEISYVYVPPRVPNSVRRPGPSLRVLPSSTEKDIPPPIAGPSKYTPEFSISLSPSVNVSVHPPSAPSRVSTIGHEEEIKGNVSQIEAVESHSDAGSSTPKASVRVVTPLDREEADVIRPVSPVNPKIIHSAFSSEEPEISYLVQHPDESLIRPVSPVEDLDPIPIASPVRIIHAWHTATPGGSAVNVIDYDSQRGGKSPSVRSRIYAPAESPRSQHRSPRLSLASSIRPATEVAMWNNDRRSVAESDGRRFVQDPQDDVPNARSAASEAVYSVAGRSPRSNRRFSLAPFDEPPIIISRSPSRQPSVRTVTDSLDEPKPEHNPITEIIVVSPVAVPPPPEIAVAPSEDVHTSPTIPESILSGGMKPSVLLRAENLRKTAWELEKQCIRIRTQKTLATQQGRHADAFALRFELEELEEKCQKLHRRAERRYYSAHNRDQVYGTIDVHGLKVKEAIRQTELALRTVQRNGGRRLRVITGRGLHSRGRRPILKHAIAEAMTVMHHFTVEHDRRNPGVIFVNL